MKLLEVEFNVSTRYVGSMVKDKTEIEVDDDATESEIDEIISEHWIEWRNEQCDGGWNILSEKTIED